MEWKIEYGSEKLLENVRAALEGLAGDENRETRRIFCRELAAMAEGFSDADSWETARKAEMERRTELEQKIAEYGQDIRRLEMLEQELIQMKEAAAAQLFAQAGAIDGAYLAGQMQQQICFADGRLQQPEQLVQKARERFPGLFRKKLEGVRPAEVKEMREPAGEMSFLERARMFQERPGEYRRTFSRQA